MEYSLTKQNPSSHRNQIERCFSLILCFSNIAIKKAAFWGECSLMFGSLMLIQHFARYFSIHPSVRYEIPNGLSIYIKLR